MTCLRRRPGGRASLSVALVLAGAILAGCVPASPDQPTLPVPPAPGPPARPSDAALCGPKVFGAEQPPEAWVRFDVTPQQAQVITSRLTKVLCREGLWRQGVGFGINFNQDKSAYFVMIHPGRSGLTARQVLNRFLGRAP
jgi:hypothetical protein